MIVTIDLFFSVADMVVYQAKDGLWLVNGSKKKKLEKIPVRNNLSLQTTVNGRTKSFNLSLRKGKFIYVDNCFRVVENDITHREPTITQFSKPLVLD